ncbi:ras-like GTP-binding protein RhoL isoform X2 [Atheta coriaria]
MGSFYRPERELTIIAVGDSDSNKTELLTKYTVNKEFYKYSFPATFNTNVRDIIVDYIPYEVTFIDCEYDDDYSIIRFADYEKADVVLLCYSIANRRTFERMITKWCVEVRKINPRLPIILVATDTERRSNARDVKFVTLQEGVDMKFALNAFALVECSVEKLVGIDDVFIEAVRSTRILPAINCTDPNKSSF